MKDGFRFAHAAGADWQECVARCAGALGKPAAGLGFVYFTDSDRGEIHCYQLLLECVAFWL